MKERDVVLDTAGMDVWEYRELKAFCRQYDTKRRRAASMLTSQARRDDDGVRRDVEAIAARRARLLEDVKLIERAAAEIEDGIWAYAIIQNVCRGMGYGHLDRSRLPTSNRSAYFRARRLFFLRLQELRNWDD